MSASEGTGRVKNLDSDRTEVGWSPNNIRYIDRDPLPVSANLAFHHSRQPSSEVKYSVVHAEIDVVGEVLRRGYHVVSWDDDAL